MGALTDIMGRFYSILQTKIGTPVSGQSALVIDGNTVLLKATRYYPHNFDKSRLPLLTATFGQGSNAIEYGRDGDSYILSKSRIVTVWAFINNMKSGADGTEETLVIAEPLVDAISECFLARTRLQLASDSDKLDCLVVDIVMGADSELTVDNNNVGILSFPFTVKYQIIIERV